MRANSKTKEGSTVPLPPQIFNEDDYCGVSTCTCAPIICMYVHMYTVHSKTSNEVQIHCITRHPSKPLSLT
jgi:hypothetical protein